MNKVMSSTAPEAPPTSLYLNQTPPLIIATCGSSDIYMYVCMYVLFIIFLDVSCEFRKRRMLVSLLLSVVWPVKLRNCRRLWRPCRGTELEGEERGRVKGKGRGRERRERER